MANRFFMTILRWALGALLSTSLWAQYAGRLPFSILGPDQGLPPGSVYCMAQDNQGFLWMGSENGLVRHAAGQWRLWSAEDGLPSAFVPQILSAKDGLWIPSLRGVVRFRDGKAERALLDGAPSMDGAGHLALDNLGRVWASVGVDIYQQREGLAFDRQSWHSPGHPFALVAGPASGALFVASPQGIHAFLSDGGVKEWGPADGLPKEGPTLLIEDGLGRLWAGSGRTLVMKEPGAARFKDESAWLPGSLTPNSQPFLDRDGSVWLPTQNGILHLAGDRTETIDTNNGLPFRWARAIFRDGEGTLWAMGPSLARLEGGGRVRNFDLSKGAEGEVVWWVTRDLQGRLLVGTDDGAARLGSKGLDLIPGTEGWRIKALAQDGEGILWMVNTIGPTLWLRPGHDRAEKAPLGEAGSFVNSVTRDLQGHVWFGHTRLGLFRLDERSERLIPEVSPAQFHLPSLGVFAVNEDSRGRLWAGSTAGLLVRETSGAWRLFTDKDGLEPHNVRGVAFLPDGSAWVQYQEPEGLTRVRLENGHLTVMEHRVKGQGLRTNLVYAIQADAAGRVWISTDQGIDRLDVPVHVGREDGMANEDCSVHALLLENNRVWVGTSAGLVRYDDTADQDLQPPPAASLLEVMCGNRVFEAPFHIGPVSHSDSTLAFRVSSPTFLDEQGLRIQVRLLGLEEPWHDLEGHLARYPALPGGHYRFEARAAQGAGPFGTPTGLDFQVRPPWWFTWWAFLGWALLLLSLIYGLLRVRVVALSRSKAALEAVVERRTEELRTRNDELSSALDHVKLLSGLLPICASCKKIRDDHGYWNQLELYISDHSEADFTHGICPDCAHELFPEIPKEIPGGPKDPPLDPSAIRGPED